MSRPLLSAKPSLSPVLAAPPTALQGETAWSLVVQEEGVQPKRVSGRQMVPRTHLQWQNWRPARAHRGLAQRTVGPEDRTYRWLISPHPGRGLCLDSHAFLESEPSRLYTMAGAMGLFSPAAGAWQPPVDASPVSWHGRKCLSGWPLYVLGLGWPGLRPCRAG